MQFEIPFASGSDNRAAEWVFAVLFNRRGISQEFFVCHIFDRKHFRQTGAAVRQRPGLVDDNCVHGFHDLQHFGILDQYTGFGTPTDAHHDRHWCGQSESTRAGDDQHGHRIHQRERQFRLDR